MQICRCRSADADLQMQICRCRSADADLKIGRCRSADADLHFPHTRRRPRRYFFKNNDNIVMLSNKTTTRTRNEPVKMAEETEMQCEALNLLDLPSELLEGILAYLTYDQTSSARQVTPLLTTFLYSFLFLHFF